MLPIAPTGPWTSLRGLGTDNNIWMRMGTWPSFGGWTRL